jgi:hypothetical protein
MDKQQLPPYQYEPLQDPGWIRVIQLHPAINADEPLRCDIIHLSRQQISKSTDRFLNHYQAVSYVWGLPTYTHQLICNVNSSLAITPNVSAILRRFRRWQSPRTLWIDAVCLNQGDSKEIGEQVPLMGNTYRRASKVLVWMGQGDDNVPKVFAFFRTLAENEKMDAVSIESLLLEIFGARSKEPIERWLQNPWFNRRWVSLFDPGVALSPGTDPTSFTKAN